MADPAGVLGAVRFLAVFRDVAPIESFDGNLLMLKSLRPDRWGRKEEQEGRIYKECIGEDQSNTLTW